MILSRSVLFTTRTNSMADNFLERHFEDYEVRKAAYLRKKKHLPKIKHHLPERPEDDAL
jgi:hypothetical protein